MPEKTEHLRINATIQTCTAICEDVLCIYQEMSTLTWGQNSQETRDAQKNFTEICPSDYTLYLKIS